MLESPGAGALGTAPEACCPRMSHRWAFIQTEAPAGLALPGPLGSLCRERQVSRVANLKKTPKRGGLFSTVWPAQEVGLVGGKWGPAAGCGQSLPGFPVTLPPASSRSQASWWPRGLAPLLNGLFLFVLFLLFVNPWVSCPVPSLNTLFTWRAEEAALGYVRTECALVVLLCCVRWGAGGAAPARPCPAPSAPPRPLHRGGGRICPCLL